MRVAQECSVRVGDLGIEPKRCEIPEDRTGRNAAELSEVSHERLTDDTALLVAFPVAEKEEAIMADGPAEREAELSALEKRIGIGGVAIEGGIGGQIVIAEEVER